MFYKGGGSAISMVRVREGEAPSIYTNMEGSITHVYEQLKLE